MDDRRDRFDSNFPADLTHAARLVAAYRTGHLLCPAPLRHMFNQSVICYTKPAANRASACHKNFLPLIESDHRVIGSIIGSSGE
jgi:hypothetical protein